LLWDHCVNSVGLLGNSTLCVYLCVLCGYIMHVVCVHVWSCCMRYVHKYVICMLRICQVCTLCSVCGVWVLCMVFYVCCLLYMWLVLCMFMCVHALIWFMWYVVYMH
jgi:hypothetical protein